VTVHKGEEFLCQVGDHQLLKEMPCTVKLATLWVEGSFVSTLAKI
jgi:hypothetical protein